ncbi:MAG TPA: hypothetical protein VNG33_00935 [Polyangiaceae bacterium]|nr:hypothetical protein [Polyangiaceae bacterium]
MTRPSMLGAARSARWLRTSLLLLFAACGGPQKLGAVGATCFRDDDCDAGLICVAPTADDMNRVCSNDPTPLISMVKGPDYGGMGGAAAVAAGAGAGGTAAGAAGVAAGGTPSGGASAGAATAGNANAGTTALGGTAGAAGGGGAAGSAGTDAAGTAGSGAGTDAGGTAGTAGSSAGTAGSDATGGAP